MTPENECIVKLVEVRLPDGRVIKPVENGVVTIDKYEATPEKGESKDV